MPREAAALAVGRAQGSMRFFLLERPLSGGDVVELCCAGGWLVGRFEWDGDVSRAPRFHFSIELEGGGVEEQILPIPARALLRWPEGNGR